MEFCQHCQNILLPRRKQQDLFCKICDKSFPMKKATKPQSPYINRKVQQKRSQQLERTRALKTAVVTEATSKLKSISEDEREAFGELLMGSGG